MPKSIKLSAEHAEDWLLISDIDISALTELRVIYDDPESLLLSGPALSEESKKHISDKLAASALIRQLLSLRQFKRSVSETLDEIAEHLYNGLEKTFADEPSAYENLRTRKELILGLLHSQSIELASKTLSLGMDHDCALLSSNMVTDIRPIFENSRQSIVGGIVVNYLKLEVYEHGEKRSVGYVLDEEDIELLIKQLQDSQNKTKAAAKLLKDQLQLKSFVVGEDSIGLH